MFNLKIIGLSALVNRYAGVKKRVAGELAKAMKEAAFLVEREGKKEITSGPNRAIRTGYLRASIAVASVLPFRATVVAGARYGIYVHEGTRYMRARPYLAQGLKNATPEIERIFGRRVRTVVEGI